MQHEATTGQLLAIPDGPTGTRETLRMMARLVRAYRKNVYIRELALQIIRNVPGHKNFAAQIRAIHAWVHKNIQYVRDVRGVETLQTPLKTIDYAAGDCDDQSILVASLLEAIGMRTRFVAIKLDPNGPFVHVYTEVSAGRGWLPVETTERWPVGTHPPKIARRMVENI